MAFARVAELVDALDLGSSSGDRVGVQVSPLAPHPTDLECLEVIDSGHSTYRGRRNESHGRLQVL